MFDAFDRLGSPSKEAPTLSHYQLLGKCPIEVSCESERRASSRISERPSGTHSTQPVFEFGCSPQLDALLFSCYLGSDLPTSKADDDYLIDTEVPAHISRFSDHIFVDRRLPRLTFDRHAVRRNSIISLFPSRVRREGLPPERPVKTWLGAAPLVLTSPYFAAISKAAL